jgi:hypothetical protein
LFGGFDGDEQLADTWEWDGEAWTQVEDTGPSARARHALAYDAARARVVLFGGEGAGDLFGDTWEWDGDEWTQVADSGPSPRRGHAMCFVAPAERTVLFGGSAESDTWAWDGTNWTELNDVGPPACEGTALVSIGESVILFGGLLILGAAPAFSGLTWELVGTDWTERQNMGPAPRFGHAGAYDLARGRVVLFGGSNALPTTAASLVGDTWELPAGGTLPGGGRAVSLAKFSVEPNTIDRVNFPSQTTATVELSGPAPANGVVVDVTCEELVADGGITSVSVSAGERTGSQFFGVPAADPGEFELEGRIRPEDNPVIASLTLLPRLASISVDPEAVLLGQSATVTVQVGLEGSSPSPPPIGIMIQFGLIGGSGVDQFPIFVPVGQDRASQTFEIANNLPAGNYAFEPRTAEGVFQAVFAVVDQNL